MDACRGLAGLLVGLIQFKKHATAHEEHKNLTHWWQYWHLVTDIAGSGAVIVGSVFYLDGYALADAIASFCVIGLIWIRVSLKFWRDIKENKKTPENPKRAHYHAR